MIVPGVVRVCRRYQDIAVGGWHPEEEIHKLAINQGVFTAAGHRYLIEGAMSKTAW